MKNRKKIEEILEHAKRADDFYKYSGSIATIIQICEDMIKEESRLEFKQYRRKELAELCPWTPDTNMSRISVSAADFRAGSPKDGDMIGRNPKNHADQWLIAAQYFADNFDPM